MLLVLSSCETFSEEIVPSWVRAEPRVRNSVAFIGEGRGESQVEAKSNALRDALVQMGEGLGYDITGDYLRELLGTERIQSIGTYLSDTYETVEKGVYRCLALVVTPEASYFALRSEEYLAMLDRQAEVRNYLSIAKEHYKANEDGEALVSALRALSVSLDGPVLDDRYAPEAALKAATGYLKAIKPVLVLKNGTSEVTVRVSRDKGWFSPRVENAVVDASFLMADIRAGIVGAKLECLTDSRGQFTFHRTNPYMLREGPLTFRIHIPDDLLQAIIDKAEDGFMDDFLSRYERSGVRYSYSDPLSVKPARAVIAVTSFNFDGEEYLEEVALEAFKSMFEAVGLGSYTIVRGEGDEQTEVYEALKASYPDRRYLFIADLGISDYREALDSVYVRADGIAVQIDSRNDSPVASVESFAAASGPDMESAAEAAITLEAKVAAGSMLSWF